MMRPAMSRTSAIDGGTGSNGGTARSGATGVPPRRAGVYNVMPPSPEMRSMTSPSSRKSNLSPPAASCSRKTKISSDPSNFSFASSPDRSSTNPIRAYSDM
jgi:hypothetical protein